MKLIKEQGRQISKKKKELKLPCNKKGIKCDLKYTHKKPSMNLQLRSNNEKFSEAVKKRKTQPENSVKY